MTKTATIILAAGAGKRMGSSGKALLELPQQKLPQHKRSRMLGLRAVDVALGAGTSPVLVLGYQARAVERTLRAVEPQLMHRCTVVHAPDWEEGLSASFRAGVQAAAHAEFERCAMLLVDQPGIGDYALATVLAAHHRGRITRGAVAQRSCHPVVFDVADALTAAEFAIGDQGGRSYLVENQHRVNLVDITAIADDADLDTPADLHLFHG